MNHILIGDSADRLKELPSDSIDLLCTDPPYGYSFMGKDWDKALPSVEIWKEALRVLKPGAFAFVMSAPRSDVQSRMALSLEEAGFEIAFTPIYWTYASGFPKAMNIGKAVDKREGNQREVVGDSPSRGMALNPKVPGVVGTNPNLPPIKLTKGTSPLEGSYGGFQPKPAVEVIIVAMKPLSEKTYVDQALKNGKGITWLDDGRIPSDEEIHVPQSDPGKRKGEVGTDLGISNADISKFQAAQAASVAKANELGRFPANLLVQDQVLGENSKYFDLDKWEQFFFCPKAAKSEKNAGADNKHPTVKPVKLMAYLITMGSRPGDVVLDPFAGSGTTGVAAKTLGRNYILIEREREYADIATARIVEADAPTVQQTLIA